MSVTLGFFCFCLGKFLGLLNGLDGTLFAMLQGHTQTMRGHLVLLQRRVAAGAAGVFHVLHGFVVVTNGLQEILIDHSDGRHTSMLVFVFVLLCLCVCEEREKKIFYEIKLERDGRKEEKKEKED